MEELLSKQEVWVTILDFLCDDAASVARFAAVNRKCQQTVFSLLRKVLEKGAPYSTAAPLAINAVKDSDPTARNELVMPVPLLNLWWSRPKAKKKQDEDNNDSAQDDQDQEERPNKRRKTEEDSEEEDAKEGGAIFDKTITQQGTMFDRLEGWGYYQAVVRAGLLQKRRVITNDQYSKDRVPHSALRMERMLEIAEQDHFRRSKALYDRCFRSEVPSQTRPSLVVPFEHDSNDPGCKIGMIGAVATFMTFEDIMPDFNVPDLAEHIKIHAYPERRKYRECDLYRQYMATVPANIHMDYGPIWTTITYTMRLLIASNDGTIKW
ncbi:MAG: hypothetical protein SGILL_002501 [Bacillariaceae sp.]